MLVGVIVGKKEVLQAGAFIGTNWLSSANDSGGLPDETVW